MHCVGVSGRWKGLGLFLLLTEEVIVGLSYIPQHGTGWRGKGRGMDGESFLVYDYGAPTWPQSEACIFGV